MSSSSGSQLRDQEAEPPQLHFVLTTFSGERCEVAVAVGAQLHDLKLVIERSPLKVPIKQQALLHGCKELHSLDAFVDPKKSVLLTLVRRGCVKQIEWLMKLDAEGPTGATNWLRHSPEEAQDNFAVVSRAVAMDPSALEHASWELRSNKEIVIEAVRRQGYLLMYTGPEMQDDKEVVLAAVRNNGSALQYASSNVVRDREVVREAVMENGNALRFASPEMRADRELVLAAVEHCGAVLQAVDPKLRADKEVVLAAVSNNSAALSYVPLSLREDREVVLSAVTTARGSLPGAVAPWLWNDTVIFDARVKALGEAEKPQRGSFIDALAGCICGSKGTTVLQPPMVTPLTS